MNSKQMLREELKAIEEKIAELDADAQRFRNALAALSEKSVKSKRPAGPRVRRNTVEPLVLDLLRANGSTPMSAEDLHVAAEEATTNGTVASLSGFRHAMDRLSRKGLVTVIDRTSHGRARLVMHKAQSVRPGEPVSQ